MTDRGNRKFHRKRRIREMRKIFSETTYRFNEQIFSAKKKRTFFVNPNQGNKEFRRKRLID